MLTAMTIATIVVLSLVALWLAPRNATVAFKWEGTPCISNSGQEYVCIKGGVHGTTTILRIGMRVGVIPDFYVRRAGAFDRLTRRLLHTGEAHTGDSAFDTAIYRGFSVGSPAQALFLGAVEARQQVVQLLTEPATTGCRWVHLECQNGWLTLRSSWWGARPIADADRVSGSAAARLEAIAQALHGATSEATPTSPERTLRYDKVIAALTMALFGSGGAMFFRILQMDSYQIIDTTQWFWLALLWGVPFAVGAVLAVAWLLWRTPQFCRALLRTLMLGAPTMVLLSAVLVHNLNVDFDRAPTKVRELAVLAKEPFCNLARPSRHCAIDLQSWSEPGAVRVYRLPGTEFRRLAIGDQVRLETHAGWLGLRWESPLDDWAPVQAR